MHIYVAVMVCGRPAYTALSARSFPRGDNMTVHVFPDRCDALDLSRMYAPAVIHNIPANRLGADENIRRAVGAFLESDSDVVVLLDSDGLLARRWYEDLRSVLPFTAGILGLYNSDAHETIENQTPHLCKKKDVGSFGLAMTKRRAKQAYNAPPRKYNWLYFWRRRLHGFDWDFSYYFYQHDIDLTVFCESRLLHYGAIGQNSKAGKLEEHGINFVDKGNRYYAKAMEFQRGL